MAEDLNLKTIDTVDTRPFKKLVMTIGELPTSFVESMTYYELLAWFTNYLETVIIPTVNNNGEAVEELQGKFIELNTAFNLLKNYVDTYFDNLDVQEEINNKLDQMAEDGVLQEIITTYIQANVAWTFDSVADMIQSTNLINGSYARTLGYYSVNDGGGSLYKITNTVSNTEYQETLDSNLYATLIVEDNILNVKSIGVKSDPAFDNTTKLNTALSYSNKYAIYFPTGLYMTSYLNRLTPNTDITIYGDNARIKLLDNVITADSQRLFSFYCADNIDITIEMYGLNIDMNYTHNQSVIISSGDVWALQHCHAIFVNGSADSNIDVIFHDIIFNDLIADGINLGGSASDIINKAIINNIISKNRTAKRSDVCITADFDSLVCSDMILDKFEIEVNSTRNNVRRSVLLNNLDLKDTLDLDIGNNDGGNVLYASNIRVDNYFNIDVEKATFSNCIFTLSNFIRINGNKIQFINCDFYTKNNSEFTTYSATAVNYIYMTTGDTDLRFKDCNIQYNNSVLTTGADTNAYFVEVRNTVSKIEFENCKINISSTLLIYRGGETTINNCIINTENTYTPVFCLFGSNTSNVTCNLYLHNNKTSGNTPLFQPPISGSAVTIYENNPEWTIGEVLNWTRFDKITSFNGGSGSLITIKEFTEFMNDTAPATGKWIKGQRVINSNPSTDYMWVCTASGNLDSGSTVPTFVAVSL